MKKPITQTHEPHSIKCLRAIAAYEGGPEKLVKKLGITEAGYYRWIREESISKTFIIPLTKLFHERISAEDLLGKFDKR